MNNNSIAHATAEPTEAEITGVLQLFAARRLHELIDVAHMLVQRYPNHGFGWRALGSALYLQGNALEAKVATQRAVLLAPDACDARCNLGQLYLQDGQLAEALEQCQAVLAQTSDYADAYALLGQIRTTQGQTEAAIAAYDRALTLNPHNVSAHFFLAVELMHHGQLQDAIARFRHALALGMEGALLASAGPEKSDFDSAQNARLLWQALVALAGAGVQAFATSGTLLGLQREGRLLPFDKDMDLGLPMEQMEVAVCCLLANGWQEMANPMALISPRAFKHSVSGTVLDLFGFQMEPASGLLVGGIWSAKIPWDWQRVVEFPGPLQLKQVRHHYGLIWELSDPDAWLQTIYGDWRIPKPEFDTLISAENLRGFSKLTECFAFLNINKAWRAGNLKKALARIEQTQKHLPDDALLQNARHKISTVLKSL